MTALCGGGTSGPKAGVPEVLSLAASGISLLLERRVGAWAIALGPLVGSIVEEAASFCGADPPADPNMQPSDWAALLAVSDAAAFGTAVGKLRDLVLRAAWYEWCECKTTTTPSPAGTFNPPAGWPTEPAPTAAPCWSTSHHQVPPNYVNDSSPNWQNYHFLGGALLPHVEQLSGTYFTGIPAAPTWRVNTLGWTKYKLTVEILDPTGTYQAGGGLTFYDAAGARIDSSNVVWEMGNATNPANQRVFWSWEADVPATAVSLGIRAWSTNTSFPKDVQWTFTAYCAGQTAGYPYSTCGPDLVARAMLDKIWEYVQLIQRQHVPFAYLQGTEHTGLTGNGELAVSGLIGVVVDVTAFPLGMGEADGQPARLFDAGWVTPGTADGWEPSVRITHDAMYVRLGGEITKIGYTIPAGFAVTIRELVREAPG